ncbi:MAG: hypothetical protein ACYC7E_03035 [Armatimonadota bacterium]
MRQLSPLIVSIIVLLLYGAVFLRTSVRNNDGRWIYALDDAYIHMSMARNTVTHGVWGVTPYEYSASSSSPLYTSLLAAGYAVTGPRELAPLYWNALFAILIVVAAWRFLVTQGVSAGRQHVMLLGIVVGVTLVPLAGMGMEHLLHIVLVIVFLALVIPDMVSDTPTARSRLLLLGVVTPLVIHARYESLALVSIAVLLYACRRRWATALLLLVMSILPIVVTGMVSVAHGGFFLPNSILLKGSLRAVDGLAMLVPYLLDHALRELFRAPTLAVMLLGAIYLFLLQRFRREPFWQGPQILLAFFILATLGHLLFGQIGVMYRYYAYLLAMGVFALGCSLAVEFARETTTPSPTPPETFAPEEASESISFHRIVLVALTGAILFLLIMRAVQVHVVVLRAATNIYHQQYQMAQFLRRHYRNAPVIANDIGAITYFTDIHLQDLCGLGSNGITGLYRSNTPLETFFSEHLPKHPSRIAMVFDRWYAPALHPSWTLIGQWKIENNVACGSDIVSFYAITPEEVAPLARAFAEFTPRLPATVQHRQLILPR